MKRIYPTLSMILLLGLQATPSFAQNDDFVKQFQQARQGMMDDYNKFRNTILTDYDKYMQGVWKEPRNLLSQNYILKAKDYLDNFYLKYI